MPYSKIDPAAYYDNDAPELDVLGKLQTRNRHRSEGKGCPFIKLGGRILYRGVDVLAHLEAHTVDTAA